MKKIRVKQIKSSIKQPAVQKKTLIALGLRKMNHAKEFVATPQILGMVAQVNHLVHVEEIN